MKCSEKQMMDTRDMVGLPNNPRTITTKDLNRLCDSIRQNGWWPHRPIAVERQDWTDKWVVLDGNQRLKAAKRIEKISKGNLQWVAISANGRKNTNFMNKTK